MSARMRIMMYSRPFHPDVGGVETMGMLLAEEFTAAGHEVRVVTESVTTQHHEYPFVVVRRPSAMQMLAETRRSDVVLHMNLSLRGAWPLLIMRRPLVIAHGAQYRRSGGKRAWRDHAKVWFARRASNIACSQAILPDLPPDTSVILNAYDDTTFSRIPANARHGMVFVGRLVPDKGAHILLDALAALRASGRVVMATIVGDGPEKAVLVARAQRLGLSDAVKFTGTLRAGALCEVLNAHRVIAIPSLVEPFGIVAPEGIACGCVAVASNLGGLPEAVGPCGLLFRAGDASALADALAQALDDPLVRTRFDTEVDAHLSRFRRKTVANRYIGVILDAWVRSRTR
jgi:glycosyltransferase involved in cell wall biosynthesis